MTVFAVAASEIKVDILSTKLYIKVHKFDHIICREVCHHSRVSSSQTGKIVTEKCEVTDVANSHRYVEYSAHSNNIRNLHKGTWVFIAKE